MKIRKLLSVTLACSMMALTVACASSGNTQQTASGAESNSSDTSSSPASSGDTFKIGVIYPMSGGNAFFGNAMVDATKIAVDWVNENGGINGKQVEAIYGDGATSSEASTEATRLIDSKGVNVIIGSMSSGNANAIRSVTERSNTILFETSAVADSVLDGKSGLTFRVCDQGSYRGYNAIKFLAEELTKDLGKSASELRVAIVNEDSSYGEAIADGAVQAAKEFGVQIVYEEAYSADTTDVTSMIMSIQKSDVDALVAVSYVNDAILIADSLIQYDCWPDVLLGCGSGWNDATVRDTIGTDMMEGIFCVDMPSSIELSMLNEENAALMSKFKEEYKSRTGIEDALTADVAFMGAYVLFTDILPNAASFSTEDIVAAIRNVDIEQTTMLWGLKFDENGQNTGAQSVLMQWQDGSLKTVWPEAYANGTYRDIPMNK